MKNVDKLKREALMAYCRWAAADIKQQNAKLRKTRG